MAGEISLRVRWPCPNHGPTNSLQATRQQKDSPPTRGWGTGEPRGGPRRRGVIRMLAPLQPHRAALKDSGIVASRVWRVNRWGGRMCLPPRVPSRCSARQRGAKPACMGSRDCRRGLFPACAVQGRSEPVCAGCPLSRERRPGTPAAVSGQDGTPAACPPRTRFRGGQNPCVIGSLPHPAGRRPPAPAPGGGPAARPNTMNHGSDQTYFPPHKRARGWEQRAPRR